ncbi:MAG: hypothetical protein WC998_05910 [Candidatus Paceibacterota bacterium]|jgi:hypothetical protein
MTPTELVELADKCREWAMSLRIQADEFEADKKGQQSATSGHGSELLQQAAEALTSAAAASQARKPTALLTFVACAPDGIHCGECEWLYKKLHCTHFDEQNLWSDDDGLPLRCDDCLQAELDAGGGKRAD